MLDPEVYEQPLCQVTVNREGVGSQICSTAIFLAKMAVDAGRRY